MQIPSSMKIGRKRYSVYTKYKLPRRINGRIYPDAKAIIIGCKSPNEARTFWHEVTHAILHDMGENWRDEKFVTRFSTRLEYAIRTAEFNGKT